MRGDRPTWVWIPKQGSSFTPHARGSTFGLGLIVVYVLVYPACAGIDLLFSVILPIRDGLPRMRGDRPIRPCLHGLRRSLPRMRGDRPQLVQSLQVRRTFTPHARGSTGLQVRPTGIWFVYPACAGIDRTLAGALSKAQRLPRMRGDRPRLLNGTRSFLLFTPHARGSTHFLYRNRANCLVYPACAGIDPRFASASSYFLSLPRMRGDRPVW